MQLLSPLFAATEVPVRGIQRFFSFHPVQQRALWIYSLALLAGRQALTTLGAGKLPALGGTRLEAHGAGIVTGRITTCTGAASLTIHVDDQGFLVGHPDETLRQTYGASETTK